MKSAVVACAGLFVAAEAWGLDRKAVEIQKRGGEFSSTVCSTFKTCIAKTAGTASSWVQPSGVTKTVNGTTTVVSTVCPTCPSSSHPMYPTSFPGTGVVTHNATQTVVNSICPTCPLTKVPFINTTATVVTSLPCPTTVFTSSGTVYTSTLAQPSTAVVEKQKVRLLTQKEKNIIVEASEKQFGPIKQAISISLSSVSPGSTAAFVVTTAPSPVAPAPLQVPEVVVSSSPAGPVETMVNSPQGPVPINEVRIPEQPSVPSTPSTPVTPENPLAAPNNPTEPEVAGNTPLSFTGGSSKVIASTAAIAAAVAAVFFF